MNTWNMFLNIKNDYKMPYYPPGEEKKQHPNIFSIE